jgi:hypothetical protein
MTPAQQRDDLSNTLLALSEVFQPILDYADGMKADLERRGWSPTAAEQASLAWLLGAIQQAFRVQA